MRKRLKKKVAKAQEESYSVIQNFDSYMNRPIAIEGQRFESIEPVAETKKKRVTQPVKPQLFIEYQDKKVSKKVSKKEMEKAIKDIWKKDGNLVKDINSLDIYVKIENSAITAYYVINDQHHGALEI